MLNVLVISSLPAVRAGLRALIGEAPGLQVVGAIAPEEGAPASIEAAFDVAVVDPPAGLDATELPALDGAAAEEHGGKPGLVVLGPLTGDDRLPLELTGRPWAYLPRQTAAEPLIAAIRAVAAGLTVIDPSVGAHLLARAAPGPRDPLPAGESLDLTAREREVLALVAEGLANKAIARRLGISEHTVKFHVAAILTKLGAGSRTEAVHLGARRGLVTL
jgi:DNA-binding NarL/FixJ family response regulator